MPSSCGQGASATAAGTVRAAGSSTSIAQCEQDIRTPLSCRGANPCSREMVQASLSPPIKTAWKARDNERRPGQAAVAQATGGAAAAGRRRLQLTAIGRAYDHGHLEHSQSNPPLLAALHERFLAAQQTLGLLPHSTAALPGPDGRPCQCRARWCSAGAQAGQQGQSPSRRAPQQAPWTHAAYSSVITCAVNDDQSDRCTQ